MNRYNDDPKIKELSSSFSLLFQNFEKVEIIEQEIENTKNEPQFNDDGTMSYSSSTETITKVDNESFDKIIATIYSIRNKLII